MIEPITADDRFPVDMLKLSRNKMNRGELIPEAAQLGMTAITLRLTAKHDLSEQGFPPERYQAACIEIFGMEAPAPHCRACIGAQANTNDSSRRGRLS